MEAWSHLAAISALGLRTEVSIPAAPVNTFGIFVTIERSKKHRLRTFPYDVHGCIGYWDPQYRRMSKKDLVHKCQTVAHDAAWTDARGKSFPKRLQTDADATYKVNLMQLPLIRINTETGRLDDGTQFDNARHGIIVQQDSHRATYLPQVFSSDTSWQELSSSLVSKSGSVGSARAHFFAYTCVTVAVSAWDTVRISALPYILAGMTTFINGNFKDQPPYSVTWGGVVTFNPNDDVRNWGTAYDVQALPNVKPSVKAAVRRMKPPTSRQALAFYALAMSDVSACPRLTIDNLEPRFEMGEVGIALAKVCKASGPVRHIMDSMAVRATHLLGDMDDIFEMNWQGQFITAASKLVQPSTAHVRALVQAWEAYYRNHFLRDRLETNYLAVAFEFVCNMRGHILEDCMLDVFVGLQTRYHNSLYYFLNRTARVDISMHVLQGARLLV